MKESLLKALLQLFTLVTDSSDAEALALAKVQVEAFLRNKIPNSKIDGFLEDFDNYVSQLSKRSTNKHKRTDHKKSSLNSVKVILLCEEINESLSRQDKIIVMLRLLEFVHVGGQISFRESGFLQTLSRVFNLDKSAFELMQHFVENADKEHKELIYIEKTKHQKLKSITKEEISGRIVVLVLPESEVLFVRQLNCDNLMIQRQAMLNSTIYQLDRGDQIIVKNSKPIYYNQIVRKYYSSIHKEQVSYFANYVSYKFSDNQTAIHPISIKEKAGTLVAIMGASGSGKSTLLNILNGNLTPASGNVFINGIEINAYPNAKQLIGYVPQEDLLIEELTVFENLWYNARLCLPNLTEQETKHKIELLLASLDLSAISHLRIGSSLNKLISGGQRKRLNIALELLREPAVLFVDEPTSGLSSHDSEVVMQLLRDIALKGKLVFTVIHQPALHIYNLLDSLIILDKGGYAVYYGHPMEAPHYFRQQAGHIKSTIEAQLDPDVMLRIIETRAVDEKGRTTQKREHDPAEWYEKFKLNFQHFKKSNSSAGKPVNSGQFQRTSYWNQFVIFFKRNMLSKWRNPSYLMVALLEVPILAFIIGYFTRFAAGTDSDPTEYIFFYNKNFPAYLFMTIVVAVFVGMQLAVEEVIRDHKILQRESFLNLSWKSYINSKFAYLFLLSAVQTLLLIWIGNAFLEVKNMNFLFAGVLFPVFVFANLLGLNLSSAFRSAVTVYILVPFMVVPQLLFSGVIIDFDTLLKPEEQSKKVPLIGEMMTSRWAFEAMAVAQFTRNNYEKHFFNFEQIKSNAWYRFALYIPKVSSLNDNTLQLLESDSEKATLESNLETIRKEVAILNLDVQTPFEELGQLNVNDYTPLIGSLLKAWLKESERYYRLVWENADLKIDNIRSSLVDELKVEDNLQSLREENHNEKLEEQLRNRNDLNRIKLINGQLIRKADYIFMPPQNNFGRAHFYAPYKQVGNLKIDTYWFNVLVIWSMNLLLYLSLIFKLPSKISKKFWR